MKDKQSIRLFLLVDAIALSMLISFRIYLHYFDTDFESLNYNNIKKIQERSKAKKEFSFAVLGNMKSSVEVFDKRIVNLINKDDIDFVISTGNSIADGSENKYRFFNKTIHKLEVPFITGVGDREVSEEGALRFYKHFGPFYFSFAAGDNYFIFIDTTEETSKVWQKEWILKELDGSDTYRNRFVFMNKSPYIPETLEDSKARDFCISDYEYSRFLIDTFSKHRVSAVFSSGAEIYDRKVIEGIPYFISGGGGGPLFANEENSFYHYMVVRVSPDEIIYEVKKINEDEKTGILGFLSSRLYYIYSLFQINFVNFLIGIGVLFMAILFVYKKGTEEVDYYRDFDDSYEDTDQDVKLNIAMFTNNYLPFVGGVPISIERLSRGLRKQGHQVYIFAPEYPEEYHDEQDNVVRCKLITYYETNQFDFPIVNVFLPEIEKEFVARNIDIVHVHHPFGIGHKGLKLANKHHIPSVLTYHTRYEKYAHNLPVGSEFFKSKIPHKIIRSFAQKCDGIIAPTQSAKEYLEHIGVIRPIAVLPTGIELEDYKQIHVEEVEKIRNKYSTDREVILCTVSRITKEKNLYFLVEGMKYVKDHCSKRFKCIIIGDGPERQGLQEAIDRYELTDIVLLIGTIEPKKIGSYYKAADLFVFASQSETQGMVLLEAMAGRCPVVAVRSSGTDDMIIQGKNGYKTKAEIKVWSEKVIELIENEELRNSMSANAHRFSENFSIEEMAKKAVKVYYRARKSKDETISFGKTLSE